MPDFLMRVSMRRGRETADEIVVPARNVARTEITWGGRWRPGGHQSYRFTSEPLTEIRMRPRDWKPRGAR